jgi:STAS domain
MDFAQRNGTVKYVILEMSPCSHIDSSGLHQLSYMVENHRSRGQEIVFVNPSIRVMDRLVASGLAEKIGDQFFFPSLHDAMTWCLHEMDCDAVSIHEGSVHHPKDTVAEGGEEHPKEDEDEEANC